jgi:hypothetical protein
MEIWANHFSYLSIAMHGHAYVHIRFPSQWNNWKDLKMLATGVLNMYLASGLWYGNSRCYNIVVAVCQCHGHLLPVCNSLLRWRAHFDHRLVSLCLYLNIIQGREDISNQGIVCYYRQMTCCSQIRKDPPSRVSQVRLIWVEQSFDPCSQVMGTNNVVHHATVGPKL